MREYGLNASVPKLDATPTRWPGFIALAAGLYEIDRRFHRQCVPMVLFRISLGSLP